MSFPCTSVRTSCTLSSPLEGKLQVPSALLCSSHLAPEHFLKSSRWSCWLYPPWAEEALMSLFPRGGQGCRFLHRSTATGAPPRPSQQRAEQARCSAVSSIPPAPSLSLPPPPALFVYYFHLLRRAVPRFSCFALLLHPRPALRLLAAGAALGGSPAIFYITIPSVPRDLGESREGRNIPLPLPEHTSTQKSKLRDLHRSPRAGGTCPAARPAGRSRERERNRPQEHPKFGVRRKVT